MSREKLETTRFQFFLPTKMLDEIKEIAKSEATTVSDLIKSLIRQYLNNNKKGK